MKKTENYVIIILAAIAIYLFSTNMVYVQEIKELDSRSKEVKDSLQAIIDSTDNYILNQEAIIDSLNVRITKDDSTLKVQNEKYESIKNKFQSQDTDTSFNFIVNYLDSISAERDGVLVR